MLTGSQYPLATDQTDTQYDWEGQLVPGRLTVRRRQGWQSASLAARYRVAAHAPSQQAELCTMFHRFHSRVDGSGIGLYVAKRSPENAGGRLEVQSKINQGSAPRVYFRP